MLVDYERGWLVLKEVIAAKPAHGKRDLFSEMARIEIECRVDEDGFDPTPRPPRRQRRRPNSVQPREAARSG